MEFIRVFTNPDRCMQRLGFLKHLVWKASISATNNISTLGKDLIDSVSQKVSVFLTPQLKDYIKTALTDPVYKNIRSAVLKSPQEFNEQQKIQIELQDFFLADPLLPSRRGKLIKDDWKVFPYFALNLCLLRKGTYSLLVRGQSFLSLVPEEEKKSFSRIDTPMASSLANPLCLSQAQKLLLLFSFIENDGDVLKELYQKLLLLTEAFSDRDAGDLLPDIYRAIAKQARTKIRSGDDLLRIQKLLDTADKIESWRGKPYTGKGARELSITPRIEPFVDLTLVLKPDPFAYRYQISDATKAFFEPFVHSETIEHFLQHSFFEAANQAYDLKAVHLDDRETIFSYIQDAYAVLKSPLGYAPILEIALLAGIYALTKRSQYFEISEAIDLLKILQKERPEFIRFNVDRWGVLTFVKFTGEL